MVALATTFHPVLGVLLFYMGPCLPTVCWLRCEHTDKQFVSLLACQRQFVVPYSEIGNPDTHLSSQHTGENGWVKSQEETHLSLRQHADGSALDVGPSDSFSAEA